MRKSPNYQPLFWLTIATIIALVACSDGNGSDTPSAAAPATEQPEAESNETSATNQPSGTLTAAGEGVTFFAADSADAETTIADGEEVEFTVLDRAQVRANGQGFVDLDSLDLEIFMAGDIVLTNTAAGPEGITDVRVQLNAGHLLLALDESSPARVEVQAGDRRLTTLEAGTRAAICQAPSGATCLNVVQGTVEWFGNGELVEVTDSKSTFAAPAEPPQPLVCSNEEDFDNWLELARRGDTEMDLAGLVQTWEDDVCPGGLDGFAGSKIPSDTGMTQVAIDEPVIGTSDFEQAPENYRQPTTLPDPVDFHVNDQLVSNEAYRSWLVWAAGNDPLKWEELAPESWIRNAPGGASTQATFPDGEGDLPVTGVTYAAAESYCPFEDKTLIDELRWELAAANGFIEYGDAQEWVATSEDYGADFGDDMRVLRGTNDILDPDAFYRQPVVDSLDRPVARQYAGIRCAADEVRRVAGVTGSENVVYSDDFAGFKNDWPRVPGDGFDIGYHGPDFYHVQSNKEHGRVLVVDDLESVTSGTIESDIFVRESSKDTGNFRYGLAVGSNEAGFLIFTVQPEEGANQYVHNWCVDLIAADDPLVAALAESGERFSHYLLPEGTNRHRDEAPCTSARAQGRAEVDSFENKLSVTVNGSEVVLSIDDQQVDSIEQEIPLDRVGFFVETFHKDLAHIHFNTLEVATS